MRCLMGYVVDLILIVESIFRVSLQDQLEGKVTQDRIDEIIYGFIAQRRRKIYMMQFENPSSLGICLQRVTWRMRLLHW